MPSPACQPVARHQLAPSMPAQPMPARPGGAFAIPPRTMLLVEDSRLAAEAVRLVCRRLGIRLRRAESLAGAALHLRVYRPDIALIDLGLPDGSGVELIRALGRSGTRPQRLLAISGDPGQEGAAIAAGADAFLLKPLSIAHHLLALTGEPGEGFDALDTDVWRERNAGADPLALRDDLMLARDLLNGPADPERLRYAGQFLASIGLSLQDKPLSEAATLARETGNSRPLVDLLRARVAASPLI